GGGGDAIPHGIHVWIERFTKLKPLAFRSAVTLAEAEDWITHMENLEEMLLPILVLGLPFAFQWGLKKWVLDRIVNTDYTNVAQVAAAARNIKLLHESGNSNKQDRDGNRVQNRGQGQQEIRGRYDHGQHVYRGRQDQSVEYKGRQDRDQDQRSAGRNGDDCQGQGSLGQRMSTETLPPLPLCATYGKPHPGVCYKATGGCFTYGSTQHKVKDCPQGKHKQSMSTDLARLPPTTGWVYATTRGQAAKTSGL
nr:zinc finger, CCHC-type, retrotransposon Gag domain protein [Tanacetum cinerariifolium]